MKMLDLIKNLSKAKKTTAKIAGISGATLLLFYMIQSMRLELNDFRERIVKLETILEVK